MKAIRDQLKLRYRKAKPIRLLDGKIEDFPLTFSEMLEIEGLIVKDLMFLILENYNNFLQKETIKRGYHFINQNGITACAIDLPQLKYNFDEWRKCQRYCSQKLTENGYVPYIKQTENKNIQGSLHNTIRYYLKPSYKNMASLPADQIYGNISLELVLVNDKLFRFILRANYYSDRNYQKEKPFTELLQLLAGAD